MKRQVPRICVLRCANVSHGSEKCFEPTQHFFQVDHKVALSHRRCNMVADHWNFTAARQAHTGTDEQLANVKSDPLVDRIHRHICHEHVDGDSRRGLQ